MRCVVTASHALARPGPALLATSRRAGAGAWSLRAPAPSAAAAAALGAALSALARLAAEPAVRAVGAAAAPGPHALHRRLFSASGPLPDELRRLSVEEVRQWLITSIGIKSEHADKVAQQEFYGKQLLLITKDELQRIGVPLGPAGEIEVAVKQLAAVPAGDADNATSYEQLFEALRNAKSVASESGSALVKLPAGVKWPQLGAQPLFVRSFYEGCVDGVLKPFETGDGVGAARKFTIIGNEGIGKSAFGAYLLWRAVQARRTVAYVSDKVDDSFVCHKDGRVACFDLQDFRQGTSRVRKDESALLICDGVTPPFCDAFTVLVTWPKRSRWKEFDKCVDARRLYFPVFSRAEIGDMLRTCFPHLHGAEAEAGVWDRYNRWGGIPRYVLGKPDKRSQKLLSSAMSGIDFKQLSYLLDSLAENESDTASSLVLAHLMPVGEQEGGSFVRPDCIDSYDLARTKPGSPYIKSVLLGAAA